MFRNYFRTAVRNLAKNKVFSFINIFGLAMGLACCMLIAIYVKDELSYDKYPALAQQIYRVQLNTTGNGHVETYPNVDIAVGAGIKNAFPGVESFTRLSPMRPSFIKLGDQQFKEEKLASADANFLQVFSIPFVKGNTQTALAEPNSLVVTKSFATKYFGDKDPMGQALIIGVTPYKITGLIDKVPDNSHFHYDAFTSFSFPPTTPQTWSNVGFFTYVVLKKNADPKTIEAKLPSLVAKYVVPEIVNDMGVSLAEAQKSVNTFQFFLQPLSKIHLYSDTKYELEANGDVKYVYIFSVLAIFILLLACVNFTNLSTVSSARRAREVGIRKVMGSEKKQLISQFLMESILLSYCAILLALLVMYLLLPFFDRLTGKHLNISLFLNGPFIAISLLLGLVVGALAGLYPAFFLSSLNTINILKGASSTTTTRKSPLRSALVVFQFTVSIALIIATIVVYRQLNYMQDKKLGYDKEQIVYLQDAYTLGAAEVQTAFKQSLLKDRRIERVSIGTNVPGNPDMDGTQVFAKDKVSDETNSEIHANIFHVDYDYIPTLGISVVKGRNFSREFTTDSFAVVINEAAVRDLGWAGTDPIGKTIVRSGQHEYKVIGVMSDFHYASVKQKIAPLLLRFGTPYRTGVIIKLKTADLKNLMTDIKKQWDTFNPGAPFSYYFLDNKFNSLYAAEQKTGQVFASFAMAAILIACLGLFGLATYIIQQRTKEIGIRKIFGASVKSVLVLVSNEFLALVAIAFAISVPLAWWSMNSWLQGFAYRIDISWWIFAVAGLSAFLIALVTVSFHAVKAAIANPVKSLRAE